MNKLRVLVLLSLRSLVSHKTKSIIVGTILFFGAFLAVFGFAMLDSVQRSMEKSITKSVAGNIQLYAKDAHDALALFGSGPQRPEPMDIGVVDSFSKVRDSLGKVPNIEAIVPMAVDVAFISGGNDLDCILEAFRKAVQEKNTSFAEGRREQIIEIAKLLEAEQKYTVAMANKSTNAESKLADLQKASSDEFWKTFNDDPEGHLLFLDTHLAPLMQDGRTIPLRYLATDLETFSKNFDRFEIIDGTAIPSGKRGFLFNKKFYEENVKAKVARALDEIHEALSHQGTTIAGDPILTSRATQLSRLYRAITLQLDREETKTLNDAFDKEIPEVKGPMADRVKAFLTLNDQNFERRYKFFYAVIAPMIELYDVRIGDTLTLRTVTRRGQLTAANVKVYGTFSFRGLDKSDFAGGHNIMDLVTFRQLYDLLNEGNKEETESLRRKSAEVTTENADDVFFGKPLEIVTHEAKDFNEFAGVDFASARARDKALSTETFDPKTIEQGPVLNMAVVLKDPTKISETLEQIRAIVEPEGVQAVDWKKAAGMVGQFIDLVRLLLFVALLITFLVALVIINNAMVTATMERIGEIGTMRAVGAPRSFVLGMFLSETLVLAGLASGAGSLVAVVILTVLGRTGISAHGSSPLIFLFAGPELFPAVSLVNFLAGIGVILAVGLVSGMYPAVIATRVQPIVAMQTKE